MPAAANEEFEKLLRQPMEADNEETLESNLNTGEVNLMSGGDAQGEPKDKWNVVYLIFLLFGIGGTVPWNFFITANGYWEYKFRDVNQTWPNDDPSKRTTLQAKFESYLSIAAMIPGLLCYVICSIFSNRCSLHSRIIIPSSIIAVSFIITIIFSELNTDPWQSGFFWTTILLIIFMNGSAAFFQASTFGIASSMNRKYIHALMNGQAIGGILASIARILTLLIDAPETTSAFYYFMGAFVIVFTCLIAYFTLLCTTYFRRCDSQVKGYKLQAINDDSKESLRITIWLILSKIKFYAICVVIVFATTLSIFPAMATLVVSDNHASGSAWTGKYFVPITCFLLFNIGDFCGRFMANFITLIPSNNAILLTVCIVRIAYIPLLMLCNAHPRYYLPTVFDNDVAFIVLMSTFALSNGYLASFCMSRAQKRIEPSNQELAGILMSLFMATGVASGAMLSTFIVTLL